MGQRLNIEIMSDGKVLANSYYHWSGFTSSSLGLTQEILNNIANISCDDEIANAIKLLETTGAGMTENEMYYAKSHIKDFEKYNFKPTNGRNDGLIAITENGIRETEAWEEARVIIDLTSKSVNFGAVWTSTKEEYKKDYEEECNYPSKEIDLSSIPFDNFLEVNNIIQELIDSGNYGIELQNDKIYRFIE